jgi:hypothetical protein
VRDGKGGRKMGFYRGTRGRFGGRFSYGAGTEVADPGPVMILIEEPGELGENKEAELALIEEDNNNLESIEAALVEETIEDTAQAAQAAQEPAIEDPAVENINIIEPQCQPSEAKKHEDVNEPITPKNISVNYSSAKPKAATPSTGSSSQKNNQSQNQIQGSTTPKTTATTKKTCQNSNHHHDKKTNSNAKTPKAMEKVAKAKEKALNRVRHKVALIKTKVPPR